MIAIRTQVRPGEGTRCATACRHPPYFCRSALVRTKGDRHTGGRPDGRPILGSKKCNLLGRTAIQWKNENVRRVTVIPRKRNSRPVGRKAWVCVERGARRQLSGLDSPIVLPCCQPEIRVSEIMEIHHPFPVAKYTEARPISCAREGGRGRRARL